MPIEAEGLGFAFPILSMLILFPAVVAGLILLISSVAGRPSDRGVMMAGIAVSGLVFLLSLIALLPFDSGSAEFQLIEDVKWFGPIHYKLGVDGISLLLIVLTTFLTPLCLIASWDSIKTRVTEYVACFLILEAMVIGVFCALDLVLFYFFFEGGLIPMFLIIGIWGGQNRVYAAFKFFLYTVLGSLFMLVAILTMYIISGTTDIPTLQNYHFDEGLQTWLWLAFFASFAVKLPMWPVHTWLPDAHVQAPTAGSVILAGILLKMGGYGFFRFSLPMFPEASVLFQPFMFWLSVIAIVYTSLVAFRQTDIKKLIAYSSVAHMGFVTLGLFSFNLQGAQGAMFQMVSHGFISSALFLCVGVIYDRMHTREISFYGGVVHKMPVFAAIFMVFAMANVGLPGTSGFIGEILSMAGSFQASTWATFGAASGVIFSAVYMLTLYRKVIFGEIVNSALEELTDMNMRELVTIVPLLVLTIYFGFFPSPILDFAEAAIENMLQFADVPVEATITATEAHS